MSRKLLLIALLAVCPGSAVAGTAVSVSQEQLMASADAAVLGRIVAIQSSPDTKGALYSYLSLEVERDLLGGLPSQTTIYLRERGGRYGDIATWGFGAPEYQVGERVLAFLKLRDDGFFQTDHMFQGKFRAADSGRLEALMPGGVRLLEGQTPRFESLDQVERSALRQPRRRLSRWVERLQLTAPEILNRFSFEGVGAIAAPRTGGSGAQYYMLAAGGIRWRQFDTGGSVSYVVNLTDAPLDAATTTSAINASLQAWNDVASTQISLVNGGSTALRGNNNFGTNVITFGDPDNDVPDLSGCSGTLAIAYTTFTAASTHTVSGINFRELLDADIVFNNGIQCSMTTVNRLAEVCGHEVGHTIGLAHSSENPSEPSFVLADALMYYRARLDERGASVRADDIAAVQVVYPDGSVVCNYSLSPTSRSHGSGAESSTVGVTTTAGCSWTAASNASWITVTSGASGNGSGTVGYSVSANSTGSSRSGSLTIAGQTFSITQAAAACTYLISPTSRSHGAGAASSTVAVTAGSGCGWTASSNASWITISSGSSGTGNGTVGYSVTANSTGSQRTGSATIAGQVFSVTQAAGACSYLISPTARSHGGGTESSTVAVTTSCSWTASSNNSWITITSGSSGTGNGTAGYTVAANSTGFSRSGSLTIAGQIFAVTQAPATSCTYLISPTTRSHGSAAESATVAVTTASGCSWSASSNASWITITSGSSGTGNATVGYTVAANSTGSQRTGSATIAGQIFSVTQSAAAATCTYVISPTTRSHGSGAESSTVAVTTASGCSWTSSSNAAWITITSGSSGTGNGTVGYAVTANSTGTQRSGSATIAGQTFSVTQAAGACSYSITPTSRSHGAGSEAGTIAVTTASGCSWTAVSNAAWVAITSGVNGTGNGTVSYSTVANSASGPRTGTLTVAGQTFTVTQSGRAELGVLFPTTSRFNPQLQSLNDSLQTSMALLLPPVGTVDPLAPPVETLQFRARNVDGSQQQDPAGSIYWGQQLGVHADDLLNLPNLRKVTAPSALDALAGETNIRGFFLIHSSDYGNMDGVSSDFRVGKKLVLAGLRYRRANIGSAVTRQTHVFLDNPGTAAATVSVRLIVPFPAGDQYEIATLNLPAKASVFSSLDKLFVSLSGGGPGFDLPSGSHLVVEASAELRGMLVFENGKSSIAAAKAIIPELSAAEKLATSRRLYAPFVTVSRSSGASEVDRFDSALTLYNGDATDEASVTIRAFGPSGSPMFPSGSSVKVTVRAGGQVTLPVLRRDGGPGLFLDDPSIPGPDPRNGYLEIVINKDVSAFGTRGSLNVHGFTSVKFAGDNETIIPLTASGLEQAYFLHVAHNPGQGPFRTALAILNPEDAATTVKIEIFEANNAATAGDRARLGQPSYVGRISLAGHQQTIKFVDQLINDAQSISGQPKPALTTQLGGYIRLTSENPAVKPMTFATYFSVDESAGFVIIALASIDPG